MASFNDILASVEGIISQAKDVASNVQAISLPTINTGTGLPAEIEATSDTEPGLPVVSTTNPMLKWYIGGAVALVIAYLIFRKK